MTARDVLYVAVTAGVALAYAAMAIAAQGCPDDTVLVHAVAWPSWRCAVVVP